MELTKRFARFIVETRYETIPKEVVTLAKERLLDTIGAMLAGYSGWDYTEELMLACAELGEGDLPVIGTNNLAQWPAARAAMLDATFAHAIELDDGHKFAGVHAGAVVISTALVMGAKQKSHGKDILAAIVIGYEVVYRLAVAQSPALIDRGFHPSAVCDVFGAMAVAGKLMGLSEEQLANGLGMAGLFSSGLKEASISGQQFKCVMVGNAAFNGITAAYMASKGLEGSLTVLEGSKGLFRTLSAYVEPAEVCKGIGENYMIADTYSKFYPTCRHAQPAIEAILNLCDTNKINSTQVKRVYVGTHHVAYETTGTNQQPRNPGEAKFSLPYGVALALVDRSVAVRHLRLEAYTDERYLTLSRRVAVSIDENVEALYPKRRGAKVRIEMEDGAVYEAECYDLKGSPQNPVGYSDLEKKFIASATGLLSEARIDELRKRCAAFEQEEDSIAFLTLLNW